MSEVKTNKISPATSTTVTLGDSGDTIALGSGVTQTGFSDEAQYFFCSMSGSNQNVNDSTNTKVNINTVALDNKSGFDTTNNKYVITSTTAGIWKIGGQVCGFHGTSDYLRAVFALLYKNGSSLGDPYDSIHDIGGAYGLEFTTQSVNAIVSLVAGDYIELYGKVIRSSGSAQNQILQRATNFYGHRIAAS